MQASIRTRHSTTPSPGFTFRSISPDGRSYIEPVLGSRLLGLINSRAVLSGEKISSAPNTHRPLQFSKETPRSCMGSARRNNTKKLIAPPVRRSPRHSIRAQTAITSVLSKSRAKLDVAALSSEGSEIPEDESEAMPELIEESPVMADVMENDSESAPEDEPESADSLHSSPVPSPSATPLAIRSPPLSIETGFTTPHVESFSARNNSTLDTARPHRIDGSTHETPHSPCSLINVVTSAGMLVSRRCYSPRRACDFAAGSATNRFRASENVLDVNPPDVNQDNGGTGQVNPGKKVDISRFLPARWRASVPHSSGSQITSARHYPTGLHIRRTVSMIQIERPRFSSDRISQPLLRGGFSQPQSPVLRGCGSEMREANRKFGFPRKSAPQPRYTWQLSPRI